MEESEIQAETAVNVEQTAEVQVEQPLQNQGGDFDIFGVVKEKFGREIDEDYLKNDYRTQLQQSQSLLENVRTKVESAKHIFENPDLLAVADYVKNGVGIKEALQALTLNPDEIPEERLILDSVTRNNSFIKNPDDLELLASRKFGLGEDLEIIKEEYPERYFDILKNRQEAIADQKKFLESKKLELLTPAQAQQSQFQDNIFTPENLQKFKTELSAEIESFNDMQLGEVKTAYDKKLLNEISGNILFSGDIEGYDKKVTVVEGFSSKEVLDALYFLKNKDAHLNEFVKEVGKAKSVEAIKKADELYNNVGGAQAQKTGGSRMARPVSPEEIRQSMYQ